MNSSATEEMPETSLTMLRPLLRGSDEGDTRAALERLAETYHEPLLQFVLDQGVTVDAAPDVVQGFFLELIKGCSVHKMDLTKSGGRLRVFLRLVITRYINRTEIHENRQKRGGGFRKTTLTDSNLPPVEREDAVAHCDRAWAHTLVTRVRTRLRGQCRRSGEEALFDALERCIPKNSKLDHVIDEFGLTRKQLSSRLYRIRTAYREYLLEEVSRTVFDTKETLAEARYILSVAHKW